MELELGLGLRLRLRPELELGVRVELNVRDGVFVDNIHGTQVTIIGGHVEERHDHEVDVARGRHRRDRLLSALEGGFSDPLPVDAERVDQGCVYLRFG